MGMISAYFAASSFSFTYRAQAVLLLEDDSSMNGQALKAKARLAIKHGLQSRALAWEVIQKLNLLNDPEFNARYRAGAWTELDIHHVISGFLKRLEVEQLQAAADAPKALEVGFRSGDPAKAALIVNTLIDTFITVRNENQARDVRRLTARLEAYLAQLQRDMHQAEQALSDYQASVEAQADESPAAQAKDDINQTQAALDEAQKEVEKAQARLAAIRKVSGAGMGAEALVRLKNTAETQELKARYTALSEEKISLAGRYGPKHPDMIAVNESLGSLQEQVRKQAKSVVSSAERALKNAQDEVSALEVDLQDILPAVGTDSLQDMSRDKSVRAEALERTVWRKRMLFDHFLKNYQLDTELARIQTPHIRVLYDATPPLVPAYPKMPLFIVLAALCALALSWLVVMAGQRVYRRIGLSS